MNFHLRYPSEQDTKPLHNLLCIPEVYQYLSDGVAPPYAVAEEMIQNSINSHSADGLGVWLLIEETKNQIIGAVSLTKHEEPNTVELMYLLHPDYWGRGLATQMSWTIMEKALEQEHIHQIMAGTDLPNQASLAVIERLGMTFWREVEYPMGVGVEYIFKKGDVKPDPLPSLIPFKILN